MRRRGLALALVLLTATAVGLVSSTRSSGVASAASGPACRGAAAPARYDHVIWVVMENKPAGRALGSAASPYLTGLAKACGRLSDYHGVSHPSLPNYLALTSGSTHGVADDRYPRVHPISGPSIFSAAAASGRGWATYAESMPRACLLVNAQPYVVRHNPATYYTSLRSTCAAHDRPLGTLTSGPLVSALRSGSLPAFTFIVPNLCSDTHDCPVATGDRWLSKLLPQIFASPLYAAGRTAVFVTWDEGSAKVSRIDLVAAAPAVRPGTVAGGRYDHRTLLSLTGALLGLKGMPPGDAAHAPAMRAALHL